jgi:hypothetical protein
MSLYRVKTLAEAVDASSAQTTVMSCMVAEWIVEQSNVLDRDKGAEPLSCTYMPPSDPSPCLMGLGLATCRASCRGPAVNVLRLTPHLPRHSGTGSINGALHSRGACHLLDALRMSSVHNRPGFVRSMSGMLCRSNLTETNTQTNMRHGGYTCIYHIEARLAQGVRCANQVRFDMRGLEKSRVWNGSTSTSGEAATSRDAIFFIVLHGCCAAIRRITRHIGLRPDNIFQTAFRIKM